MLPYSPRGKEERKKPAQKAQAKNIIPGWVCMFSANDSWLISFIHGRSSDLTIDALRRLPGEKSPSDMLGAKLPPYSDEFVQDFHLLPFSSGR